MLLSPVSLGCVARVADAGAVAHKPGPGHHGGSTQTQTFLRQRDFSRV